jgi:hypothetical protein
MRTKPFYPHALCTGDTKTRQSEIVGPNCARQITLTPKTLTEFKYMYTENHKSKE